MDKTILELLTAERDKLTAAIEILEGPKTTKKRGRPPGTKLAPTHSDKLKQSWTPERRERQRQAMLNRSGRSGRSAENVKEVEPNIPLGPLAEGLAKGKKKK
jgi:hypothetical protein